MACQDLFDLGLVSDSTSSLFLPHTRDNKDIRVYRDNISRVIYIKDDDYDRNKYVTGSYLGEDFEKYLSTNKLEDYGFCADTNRRLISFEPHYIGKDIIDFGCGEGAFLKRSSALCKSCAGIELSVNSQQKISLFGLPVFDSLDKIDDNSIDTIFFFHSFEHLNCPLHTLKQAYKKLRRGGHIILEVPHANDFLISVLHLDAFIEFTMWSQHLIFHTYDSLRVFLEHSGFINTTIKGVQRYPLSNHFGWLLNGKPGGHLTTLSMLDNEDISRIYELTLASLNATDTIVSISMKPL
jgi:SAM-dependent methyltransferase